ncbi:right-handed parallel beta-helix repeat-containing protein [Archangium sp.]|uniref:right-handed parallel beta-helix repeat-containing protein n=1 Tax=Archangium sp. TaxID=1872627 RepID=UPI002D7182E8|nr:right-handed parallel beta-helix repeat-containing protein [Archangium sp.]HYO58409.1 right-handed parallel beta-helix repeat-containing protein [Archangium sp.]
MRRARGLVAVAVGMATLLAGSPAARADGEGGVQCGDTITTSTRLTHDLACPDTGAPALRVVGTGVVLDLGGHTVRHTGLETPGSEGIVVLADSTVRNGTIRGFELGYVLDSDGLHNPEHVWLSRLTFIGNRVAVHHRNGNATLTLTDSLLLGNDVGLGSEQDASSGTFEVRSTHFAGHRLALSANFHSVDVVRSTFSRNETVVWCPYGSIAFTSSWIVQNTVVGRLPLGEFGYGSCAVASFVDTVIARNGSFAPTGQPAWEPFDFVLRDSWVADNGSGLLVRARTVDVQDNTWWGNGTGLTLADLPEYVPPALTGTVSDNRFLRNRGDGLRVMVPSTLTVFRNVAIDNTGWGIHAPGVIDGGGNVARGNDAGNCVGVVCASR